MQSDLNADEVRAALERVITSPEWTLSVRMGQFLRFVVEQTLRGEGSALKETVVGAEVFRRSFDYDPKVDPVVRVEARRLRLKLQEYYSNSGIADPLRIVLPKGTYQPRFERTAEAEADISRFADGPSVRRRFPPAITAAAGAVASALLIAGVWMAVSAVHPAAPLAATPRLLTGHQWHSRTPSFSPDGERIVFSRELSGDRSNLFIQTVNGGEAHPLTDGRNLDYEPAWSRDGASIAFLRQLSPQRFAVMVSPAEPGPAAAERSVAEVTVRGPLDWSSDGRSVFAADRENSALSVAIFAINVGDGRKHRVTSKGLGSVDETAPRISPDGRSVAFVRGVEAAVQDVYVSSVQGGEARRLTSEGHEVRGLAWHPDGGSVVVSLERRGEERSLWRVPLQGGAPQRITEAGIGPVSPAISAQGQCLAYVTRVVDTNLWRGRLTGNGATDVGPVTSSVGLDTGPQISPDHTQVAWRSTTGGSNEVWVAGLDGTGAHQRTRMNGPITGSAHWSPDGQWLVFDSRPEGNADIFVIPSGGGAPRALTSAKSNEVLPGYSHDGRWIYFSTDRSGAWEVWRMDTSGGQAARVAGSGAFAAVASTDGKWIYFTRQTGNTGIWRISTSGGAEERMTDEPEPNFWGQWAVSSRGIYYAVFTSDGRGRAIRRLDLATRKVTDILPLLKLPVQFDSGMSVTADESWIMWSQLDSAGSDIYVVKGFR